jgi:hypothetical protein
MQWRSPIWAAHWRIASHLPRMRQLVRPIDQQVGILPPPITPSSFGSEGS